MAKTQKRTSHWAIAYEILGSGITGGIYGSYWITRGITANTVLGYASNNASNSTSIISPLVHLSGSYLYGSSGHYLEGLLGADITILPITVADATGPGVTFKDERWLGVFGAGYRYWPKGGGFHFRLLGYYFISFSKGNTPYPWLGITLGYSFR